MDERELMAAVVDATEALLGIGIITPSPEADRALTTLHRHLEALRSFRIESNEPESVPAPTKPCDYCGVDIFFAQLAKGRWRPFDIETVDGGPGYPAGLRYLVNFDGTGEGPWAYVNPRHEGRVYVDHGQVCGGREGPRYKVAPLMRRWKINCERAELRTEDVAQGLMRLRRRLRPAEDGEEEVGHGQDG